MDLKKLKEKESILNQAKAEYNKELKEWKIRAREIVELFRNMQCSLYDENLRTDFSYWEGCNIKLNISDNSVDIAIIDDESDAIISEASVSVENFISDMWETILKSEITRLKKIEEEKYLAKKKEKEIAEFKRLQKIYGN